MDESLNKCSLIRVYKASKIMHQSPLMCKKERVQIYKVNMNQKVL